MGSYTWICLMLFYICETKTAKGHMTLDSAQDDTNSEDSSMNTMLFKFLLESLGELEDKYHKQGDKIEELETTLGELEGNLVSSENIVTEQNKKISELETKSYKIEELETNLGEQNDEILELKGNLKSSEKLIIEQNKKISELEKTRDKIDELETTLDELEGKLVSSEKLVIEQNKKISELETKQNEQCPALTAPDNGTVDVTGPQSLGTIANYSCDHGLESGTLVRYCVKGGTWTGTVPTCVSGVNITSIICEGDNETISCSGSGEVINILSAYYGRTSSEVCLHAKMSDTDCRREDENDLDLVRSSCDGQPSCDLHVDNSVFGDPCQGTYKYLEVSYNCITGSPI